MDRLLTEQEIQELRNYHSLMSSENAPAVCKKATWESRLIFAQDAKTAAYYEGIMAQNIKEAEKKLIEEIEGLNCFEADVLWWTTFKQSRGIA
jgi:hypothetical protein